MLEKQFYIIVSKIKIGGVVHYHVYKHRTGANASISLKNEKIYNKTKN